MRARAALAPHHECRALGSGFGYAFHEVGEIGTDPRLPPPHLSLTPTPEPLYSIHTDLGFEQDVLYGFRHHFIRHSSDPGDSSTRAGSKTRTRSAAAEDFNEMAAGFQAGHEGSGITSATSIDVPETPGRSTDRISRAGTFSGGTFSGGVLSPHTMFEEGDAVQFFLDGRWKNGTIQDKHYGEKEACLAVLDRFHEPPEKPIDLSGKPRVAKWVCSYVGRPSPPPHHHYHYHRH